MASNAVAPTLTATNVPKIEVNESIMVTVELDFEPPIPTVAEALKQIERRYQPDDGKGRTFAILDAYGAPTAEGNKLHISMHVSAEKPGMAALIFKGSGKTLWETRIVPSTHPPSSSFAGKGLLIMVNDDKGHPYLLNGTTVTHTIFEATLNDNGQPLSEFWPEGAEREVTLFYSSCGCPVKVMARREGDKTVRTKPLPVIFPDDPAAAATIAKLMGWK